MPIIVHEGDKPIYQLPTAKTHQAVCYNVWDLGFQKVTFNNQARAKRQVMFGWELNELVREGKFAGKRLTIHKRYTASLHEKSGLTKHLVAWRGRAFTQDERNSFDLESFIAQNCFMSIVHVKSRDGSKDYANIAGIMQLPEGMRPMASENERMTPDWIKDVIDHQLSPAEAADLNDAADQHGEEEPPF